MDKEKIEKLLPFFAYKYSKQLNPQRYGDVDAEDWVKLVDKYPEDGAAIVEAANKLSEEDWNKLESEYDKATSKEPVTSAKKGAKLDHLKTLQKHKKSKKCACGCDIVTHKKGGKLVESCACENGEAHKKMMMKQESNPNLDKVKKVTERMIALKIQ